MPCHATASAYACAAMSPSHAPALAAAADVPEGLLRAVETMHQGGERLAAVPSSLAYGVSAFVQPAHSFWGSMTA